MINSNGKRSRNIFAIRAPPVNVFKSASFKLFPCKAVSKSSRNSCVNLNEDFCFYATYCFQSISYPTSAFVSELDELSNKADARYSATSFAKP